MTIQKQTQKENLEKLASAKKNMSVLRLLIQKNLTGDVSRETIDLIIKILKSIK